MKWLAKLATLNKKGIEMGLDLQEIIITIIGSLTTIIVAIVGRKAFNKQKHKTQQAESEINLQRAALDFGMFLSEWGEIEQEIRHLFDTTALDRFIIFRAFNGANDPKWTTAVLQIRKQGHFPTSYVHYELDTEYVDRLIHIKKRNFARVITEDLPKCGTKEIYQYEKVTESLWAFLDRQKYRNTSAAVMTYCSFATTDEGGFTDDDIAQLKIISSRLKGAALSFVQ